MFAEPNKEENRIKVVAPLAVMGKRLLHDPTASGYVSSGPEELYKILNAFQKHFQ